MTEGDAPAGTTRSSLWWTHRSREEAKEQNWEAFRADPAFQEVLKSEQANKTVETSRLDVHASNGFFADEVADRSARTIFVTPQCRTCKEPLRALQTSARSGMMRTNRWPEQ